MKSFRVAGAAAAFLLGAGAATAADLPLPAPAEVYKTPAVLPPTVSWTGFYGGVGFGDGLWNADTTVQSPTGVPVVGTNTQGGRGWFGQAVTGFDYQINDRFVAGVLADFSYGDTSGTFSDPNLGASGTLKEISAWAAGARVGWLFTPELLSYVSGGFTQTHFNGVNLSTAAGAPFGSLPSHTYSGWFIGGGLETTFPLLGNGWFLRTDYRFSQFESASLAEVGPAGGVVDIQTLHPYVQTATVDLIYKFNSAPAGGSGSLTSFIADFFRAPQGPSPWTGFYVAGGGGYGTWNADTSSQSPAGVSISGAGTQGGRGWFGTVNAGFDYQLTSRIVVGAFGDFDFADITGTFQDQNPTPTGTIAGTLTENWAWAGGVRAGWTVTPQILSYYDVGFTQAAFSGVGLTGNTSANLGAPVANLGSHTYNGWFLGSGLEMALPFIGRGWYGRVEYRYSEYENANIPELATGGGVRDIVAIRPNLQTVRTELIYRF